jgi:hypothetical protein
MKPSGVRHCLLLQDTVWGTDSYEKASTVNTRSSTTIGRHSNTEEICMRRFVQLSALQHWLMPHAC